MASPTAVYDDPEIATRISQYELAFRMQSSVPELMDVSDEPQHVLDLYGTKGGRRFVRLELPAGPPAGRTRRAVHSALSSRLGPSRLGQGAFAGTAKEVDQGVAALITDLKQRDMLKDTIIVFGSEFGRTPMAQGNGRDHHLAGFTMWFAGGGFKPGISYGATDELGYHAVENRVSVHDVHATLLHLMGIDHARFTYKFQGLDSKLTGVEEANVIQELLI